MVAALLLAGWLAQAEPAPPVPPAAPPPSPAGLTAPVAPPPPPLDNALGVYAGLGHRVGDPASAVGPVNGVSVGGAYRRRYAGGQSGPELAAGLDFFYDQFQTGVTGSAMIAPGQEQSFAADRTLSETSFVAVQAFAWRAGRLRPFAELGFGATVAYFSSPEIMFRPGSLESVQPLGRAAAGLEVTVYREVAIAARVAYAHTFTRPTLTTDQASGKVTYALLGDFVDFDLGAVIRF